MVLKKSLRNKWYKALSLKSLKSFFPKDETCIVVLYGTQHIHRQSPCKATPFQAMPRLQMYIIQHRQLVHDYLRFTGLTTHLAHFTKERPSYFALLEEY